jgi:NADH:ubiquinone oxidoreductase subunit F (NADH-binding)/(2Fe-2S) ferredoxin/NAD-dependent dihydropyrimidine dehydrogenase PreA subunit
MTERITTREQLDALKARNLKRLASVEQRIAVCNGTGCRACGGVEVKDALVAAVASHGLSDRVAVMPTGCQGYCQRGPLVTVEPAGIFYHGVKPADAERIVAATIERGELVDDLLLADPVTGERIPRRDEVRFYTGQQRIVFALNGKIDPVSIGDYIAHDGYQALAKALLDMGPESIVDEVLRAGLRGRGGAGFPTGRKWKFTRDALGDVKVVVCNADEGDPGAFMDRSLIEATPHAVLEGMLIAAHAIGASQGFIYVRAEYPLAVKHIRKAIDDARSLGLIGKGVFGTDFSIDVHVMEGAGAFVCGEETALLQSIEGKRGMPRPRPPFPAQSGLWGRPTNLNNVETYANVPPIILRGAEWYTGIGTETSKGTKIFSLTGKVANNGLVEVPMGTTLRHIIYEVGGGMRDGREFKAAQLGGPSGGCLPADLLDVPIDYESLGEHGAIMGSGGVIVLDDTACMVSVARFFLDFTASESCGKCVPCRVGIPTMRDILVRITEGTGEPEDLDRLRELAERVKSSALCGLGQTAPNPVLSTLRYFEDEYRAHIEDRICPSGVCEALAPPYRIDPEACKACDQCAKVCPTGAARGTPGEPPYEIDEGLCIRCGACFKACPFGAVTRGARS